MNDHQNSLIMAHLENAYNFVVTYTERSEN